MSSGVQHMLILWTALRSKTDLNIVNRAVKSLCVNGRDGLFVNTCRSSKLRYDVVREPRTVQGLGTASGIHIGPLHKTAGVVGGWNGAGRAGDMSSSRDS